MPEFGQELLGLYEDGQIRIRVNYTDLHSWNILRAFFQHYFKLHRHSVQEVYEVLRFLYPRQEILIC
jgi:hypothetical protein